MRKTLTNKGVAALRPRAQRYTFPDPEMRGHYVRVQPSGARSFVAVTRDSSGKQIWVNLGAADVTTIEEARETARTAIKRIKAGLPALKSPPVKPELVSQRCGKLAEASRRKREAALTVRDKTLSQQICFPALAGPRFREH